MLVVSGQRALRVRLLADGKSLQLERNITLVQPVSETPPISRAHLISLDLEQTVETNKNLANGWGGAFL